MDSAPTPTRTGAPQQVLRAARVLRDHQGQRRRPSSSGADLPPHRAAAGDAQLEVTVTRLKFSTGDQFDQPQHGLYMGAEVKAHALADGQDLPDIYALVGGHNYSGDAITGSTAFDPSSSS